MKPAKVVTMPIEKRRDPSSASKSGKSITSNRGTRPTISASIDPDELSPSVDWVFELETNLTLYQAPDDSPWVSFPKFPGFLLTSADCARAHCLSVRSPSQAASIVCAIHHGIRRFYGNADIEALIKLRQTLHKEAKSAIDSDSVEMAAEFFRHFPLDIPGTLSKARRLNLPMPASLKNQVAERARELGITNASMGILCVMVTVSFQTVVPPDHAALAADTVERFLRGVHRRRRVAEVLLEEVE